MRRRRRQSSLTCPFRAARLLSALARPLARASLGIMHQRLTLEIHRSMRALIGRRSSAGAVGALVDAAPAAPPPLPHGSGCRRGRRGRQRGQPRAGGRPAPGRRRRDLRAGNRHGAGGRSVCRRTFGAPGRENQLCPRPPSRTRMPNVWRRRGPEARSSNASAASARSWACCSRSSSGERSDARAAGSHSPVAPAARTHFTVMREKREGASSSNLCTGCCATTIPASFGTRS